MVCNDKLEVYFLVFMLYSIIKGELFASGGADKSVILWKNNLEGILKYMYVGRCTHLLD